jgi:hypothetical protein
MCTNKLFLSFSYCSLFFNIPGLAKIFHSSRIYTFFFLQTVEWYPKADQDNLIACGLDNGKVQLRR